MRTATAGEQAVLSGMQSSQYLKVEVKDAGGSWVDYELRSGVDWTDRARIFKDVNQRVAGFELALAREADGNSLAPLINSDIAPGRAVRISGARVAVGATPGASDYKTLLLGEVDRWDAAADPLVLTGRDDMGHLVDRWVETETEYGTDAGRAIESVMGDILTDWTDGRFTLYTPTSPGFLVTRYLQQEESVLSALQTLADLIGWAIDYRWDDSTSAFRLTFYEPDRTPAATEWTFGPDDYYDVEELAVDRDEVRNVVEVRYTDSATDARTSYTSTVAASVTKYGRRWMLIQEPDDSPIDSDAEAQTLADAAASDLSEPVAQQRIPVDLFWPVQLGDFYGFTANDVHYDVDQEFAVTGFEHVFADGVAGTRITTRGTGAVAHTRGWFKREQKERPPREKEAGLKLLDFREGSSTDTTITYSWKLGTDLDESWIHDYEKDQPHTVDNWPGTTRPPDSVDDSRTVEYTVTIPEPGKLKYFQVEGRRTGVSAADDMVRVLIRPTKITESEAFADGVVIANKLTESSKRFGSDVVFTAVDWDTVDWASGTITMADATAYSIGAGSTGNMASDGIRYIYLDPDASATELQVTTSITTATGEDKVLVCVAKRATGGASSGQYAFFVPAVGSFFLNADQMSDAAITEIKVATDAITTTKISDDAITTPKILAGAITTAKLDALAVTADKIAANAITATKISAGAVETDKLAANAVTAAKINVASLSAISVDAGTITAGILQQAAGSRYIDLDATSGTPFIASDNFEVLGNGVCNIGTVDISTISDGCRLGGISTPGSYIDIDGVGHIGSYSGSNLQWELTNTAGTASATEQAWIEVTTAAGTGYIRVYAAK